MAENVAPSPAKRARKPNFTPAECNVIFEAAEENLDVIKSKFSNVLSNKNKTKVWEDITDKVNSLGVCLRTVAEVKEKWRGMVSTAKKEHNKCAASRKKTRGGKQPESPQGTTFKIIELFEEDPAFSGISGGIDSAQVSDCSDEPTISKFDAESLELSSIPTVIKPSQHIPGDELGMACGSMPVNPSKDKTSKMPKKKVTIDEINEEHLAVLKKEHIKLDLEIDNLLLKNREILLRIKELEARANNSC